MPSFRLFPKRILTTYVSIYGAERRGSHGFASFSIRQGESLETLRSSTDWRRGDAQPEWRTTTLVRNSPACAACRRASISTGPTLRSSPPARRAAGCDWASAGSCIPFAVSACDRAACVASALRAPLRLHLFRSRLRFCGGGSSYGPVPLDIATPWITAAIKENFGTRHTVDVGGTILERDQAGRTAVRIVNIVVRDPDGSVVASAPRAEVGISGSSLLTGRPRAASLKLVDTALAVRIGADGQFTLMPRGGVVTPSSTPPAATTTTGVAACAGSRRAIQILSE